jgi:hypothetical protein
MPGAPSRAAPPREQPTSSMLKIAMPIALLGMAMAAPTPMQKSDTHRLSNMGGLPEGAPIPDCTPHLPGSPCSCELLRAHAAEAENSDCFDLGDFACDPVWYYFNYAQVERYCPQSEYQDCDVCVQYYNSANSYFKKTEKYDGLIDACSCTGNDNEIECTKSPKRHCATGVPCPKTGTRYKYGNWSMCGAQ